MPHILAVAGHIFAVVVTCIGIAAAGLLVVFALPVLLADLLKGDKERWQKGNWIVTTDTTRVGFGILFSLTSEGKLRSVGMHWSAVQVFWQRLS